MRRCAGGELGALIAARRARLGNALMFAIAFRRGAEAVRRANGANAPKHAA